MTNIKTQKHFEHVVFKGKNQLSLSRFEQISLVEKPLYYFWLGQNIKLVLGFKKVNNFSFGVDNIIKFHIVYHFYPDSHYTYWNVSPGAISLCSAQWANIIGICQVC